MDYGIARRRREGPLRGPETGRRRPMRATARHLCESAGSAVPPRGLQPVFVEHVLAASGFALASLARSKDGLRNGRFVGALNRALAIGAGWRASYRILQIRIRSHRSLSVRKP